MSYLIINLNFIGYKLFPKLMSRKLNDFNKTALANFLEIDDGNLSHWLHGNNPISLINLSRICRKLSEYYNLTITPEIMQTQNLEIWLKEHQLKYQFPEQPLSLIKDAPDLLENITFLSELLTINQTLSPKSLTIHHKKKRLSQYPKIP